MAAVHSLALTDDEAAAIALLANGAWRAPLPTLDETSEAELAAAILRGRRSLVVRELAKPDGTALGRAAQVLSALGRGPCAVFMLVDAADGWVPGGLTSYLYGSAPDQVELCHVVAAAGVHYFRIQPPPEQWLALTGLAEAVFQDGFTEAAEGGQQPAAAILSVAGGVGVRSLRVAQGAVGTVPRRVEGSAPVKFSSVAEAVSWLETAASLSESAGGSVAPCG